MKNLATNPEANETTLRVPQKYRHMIASIHHEPSGYWVYTAEGYYSPMMQTGTIHESSQKATLAEIRTITECGTDEMFPHCMCGHDCLEA